MDFPEINPIIFQIGPLALRWYALAYVVGILGGLYYIQFFLIRRAELWGDVVPPGEQNFHDFVLWAVIGVILGGRLGYVLFYQPDFYFNHPSQIFAVWKGGMSFHGGFLGTIVAAVLFARKHKINFWSFGDLICAIAPIGLFLGRCANFINGELWGRVSDVPWAIIFPRGGPLPRHPSQLYEAFLEGILLFFILQVAIFYFRALKKPGAVSALFLFGYGVARTSAEFFREPDGYIIGGLTTGMGLSLPMMIIGIVIGVNLYVRALR